MEQTSAHIRLPRRCCWLASWLRRARPLRAELLAAAGWLAGWLLLAAAESGLCQDSLYQTPNAFGSTF